MDQYIESSIKSKLTMVIMATCAIMLVVVGGVFLASELYARQATLKQENKILATSLAEQLRKPLLLEDFEQAKQLLEALKQQRNVHACYLFDRHGHAVAEYLIRDRTEIALPALRYDFSDENWPREQLPDSKLNFALNYYSSFTPIVFEGKEIGVLYLLSDLKKFYVGINGALIGFALAFVLLIFLSFFLAGVMQKPVSVPLLNLARLMTRISENKDYSIRAEKQTQDEVGILVDGFNNMLTQVEKHQRTLDKQQQLLEKAVSERTTELHDAIEKLEVARRQADEANKAKSDFLSRMTHELRTPLIGVLGMNELLMRTKLDAQQQLLVKTVANSGQELLQLISEVLDFSKIEANKLSLSLGEVELYRIVETCVELLAPQALDKGLQLVADIPISSTWVVTADEIRIRQILMNLIGNAIKFTSSGHVVVRLLCPGNVSERGDFIIEVEDSGEGIDEEVSAAIFDAFYQVDGSDTREKTGAGLGLAIVKQLVSLMQGRIVVERTPIGGTVFRIFLSFPVVRFNDFYLPEEMEQVQVLVCASDDLYSRVLVRNLRQLGVSLNFYKDAADALVFLASAHRRSPALRFCFVDVSITAKDVINALIRQNKMFSDLHVFWLCHDRTQVFDLPAGEVLFPFPVSWDNIYKAIVDNKTKIAEMILVREAPTAMMESQESESGAFLFSQNAASRELLRLGLQKVLKNIAVISDYNCCHLGDKALMPSNSILFFDLDHLDLHSLKDINREGSDNLHVVISKNTVLPINPELYDLVLKKPLSANELQKLQNFLAGMAYGGADRQVSV